LKTLVQHHSTDHHRAPIYHEFTPPSRAHRSWDRSPSTRARFAVARDLRSIAESRFIRVATPTWRTRRTTYKHDARCVPVASPDMALVRSRPRLARQSARNRVFSKEETPYVDGRRVVVAVVALATGTDLRSRYQHGTEHAEPLGAYERFLRTAARSVTTDTMRRLYLLVRHVQPVRLPTCLPAEFSTPVSLPPLRYRTRPPEAFTWRTPDSHEPSRNRPIIPLNAEFEFCRAVE